MTDSPVFVPTLISGIIAIVLAVLAGIDYILNEGAHAAAIIGIGTVLEGLIWGGVGVAYAVARIPEKAPELHPSDG